MNHLPHTGAKRLCSRSGRPERDRSAGGGPMAPLPRLIGRGRALKVPLGADDISGDVAELYGYLNRALPNQQLDAFVDAFAVRISSFDKRPL
jgi:enoyl-CoA hydratase/carnithine racemase